MWDYLAIFGREQGRLMLATLITGACLFAFYAGIRIASDDAVPLIPIALAVMCFVLALRV